MSSLVKDIEARLPALDVDVIFDVGANVGQSAKTYRDAFPEAWIYAFEPVKAAFDELSEAVVGDERTRCVNVALGRAPGHATMISDGASTKNRIVTKASPEIPVVDVTVERGDDVRARHGIERINLLKVDAEGHDLEVLVGFQQSLAALRIDLIQVEASMARRNTRHVLLDAFVGFLEPLGYSLFMLYHLIQERDGRPLLRRANAVFISEDAVAANLRPRK